MSEPSIPSILYVLVVAITVLFVNATIASHDLVGVTLSLSVLGVFVLTAIFADRVSPLPLVLGLLLGGAFSFFINQ